MQYDELVYFKNSRNNWLWLYLVLNDEDCQRLVSIAYVNVLLALVLEIILLDLIGGIAQKVDSNVTHIQEIPHLMQLCSSGLTKEAVGWSG